MSFCHFYALCFAHTISLFFHCVKQVSFMWRLDVVMMACRCQWSFTLGLSIKLLCNRILLLPNKCLKKHQHIKLTCWFYSLLLHLLIYDWSIPLFSLQILTRYVRVLFLNRLERIYRDNNNYNQAFLYNRKGGAIISASPFWTIWRTFSFIYGCRFHPQKHFSTSPKYWRRTAQ